MEQNKEYSMEELLNETQMTELKVHDVVKGEVISVTDKCAKINLGTFTEGTIYLDHFTTDKSVESLRKLIKVGDIVEAEVTKVSGEYSENSEILLSRLNTEKKDNFLKFKEENKEGTNVSAKVVKVIKNVGYILNYAGLEFFMSVKDLKDTQLSVGEVLSVKIISYNDDKQSGYVSRYAVIREEKEKEYQERLKAREELEQQKKAEIEALNVGDIVKGTVYKFVEYGAFVKLNYASGLIRLKEVDHEYIKSASEKLAIDEVVELKVLSKDNGKLELSRKACVKHPVEIYCETHKVSDTVTGKVVNKMAFGVLVELAPMVTALLHRSELSWNPNDNTMGSLLIGDEVTASIIKVDVEGRKLGLSRKPLLDNPWERVDAQVGTVAENVKISEVLENGFKVEAFGVDGFIPFNKIDTQGKNIKATDLYQVGDTITALVVEIDPKRWVLVLSEKDFKAMEERAHFEKYMNEQDEETTTTIGDIFKEALK